MYIVLYAFHIKNDKEDDFLKGWKGLTSSIYQYEGSLGSRLHKTEANEYIAYAQWPSKVHFDNSGNNLPKSVDYFRNLMKMSCDKIEVLKKMVVTEDLLKEKQYE